MTPSPTLRRALLALLLMTVWPAMLVWAQDTRGSVVPDGLVTLADGTTVEVQSLKAGVRVLAWQSDGNRTTAKVSAVRRQHSDSFLLVKVGDRELRATGAHRIALAGGTLVRLDKVKVGDTVWLGGTNGPVEASITSIRVFPSSLITYDLTLEGHEMFQLDGVVVGD